MVQVTEGIVLHSIRYGDSSRIARIFTRTSGLRSFMIRQGKGLRSDRSICSVFNILELGFHARENANIIQPVNLKRAIALSQIASDPVKGAMSLFLAEVLYKTLHDDYHNEGLYDFLRNAIVHLETSSNPVNVHLWMLAQIIGYYGFAPEPVNTGEAFFDLNSGEFSSGKPAHPYYLEAPDSDLFVSIFSMSEKEIINLEMSNNLRGLILEKMVDYLKIHHEGVREINSHHVLREVFRG